MGSPILRRLRRKFVALVVALVGTVMVVMMGTALYSMHANQRRIVDDALDNNLQGSIDSVPVIGGQAGKRDSSGTHANMLSMGVEISDDGVVLQTSDAFASIDAKALQQVIDQVLESGKSSGELAEKHLCWKAASTDSGSIRIAIVDTTASDANFRGAIVHDLEIASAGLAAVFVISWVISNWALAPVSRAWEQQKRFVADASHELKTPLAVILANTEILQKDGAVPRDSRRWVDSTAEEAKHMKGLVGELLQLARADESAAGISDAMRREDVDLSDLVASAALEFDAVAFERGVTIETSLEDGVAVSGDPEWLDRLVRILMDNAVKYASPSTAVEVSLARRGKEARLTVTDHGAVMDKEDLEHVFDRFWRSDKARSRDAGSGGFGLGLAIAKATVEAHGGTIACTSDERDGTTFSVCLRGANV